MTQGRPACSGSACPAAVLLHAAGVLMIMTIDAEQFPVAAVRRIVVVVVILVMDRQFPHFFAFKFAGAATAYMGEEFQRLFPIAGQTILLFPAHFGNQTVLLFGEMIFF